MAVLAIVIAAYNVGYRVGLKGVAGSVGAIIALLATVLIASAGERFSELYSFCLTLFFIATIAMGLGVAVRRIRRPAFASRAVVEKPARHASIRAIAIDRLLQGDTIEAVSRELSLPPEHIQEWRSQLAQSGEKTDHPLSRDSLWSRLGHWPAIAALLGLILYVPTYIAYEYFYGNLGVSPDEVGLTYANVLSRESTWLISSILVLTAALGALSLCFIAAAQPHSVSRTLISGGVPAPSKSIIRYSGLLVGLPLIALLVQAVVFQVSSVPTWDIVEGMPIYATPGSFFKGRADLVEVSWISGPPPPGIPKRMLYLGQSGGVAVFWNAAEKAPIRLPTGSITLTSIYTEPGWYTLEVMDSGELSLSPWETAEDSEDINFWPLGVKRPTRRGSGCSNEEWKEAIERVSPAYTRVVRVPSRSLFSPGSFAYDLLYLPPDYKSLSVELVRAGAPLDEQGLRDGVSHMAQEELLAAAHDARKSGRKLSLPCL